MDLIRNDVKNKMAAIVGGSHWRDIRLAMFGVKNTEKNSGETYKLSSDVGAYIFALLKKS